MDDDKGLSLILSSFFSLGNQNKTRKEKKSCVWCLIVLSSLGINGVMREKGPFNFPRCR